MYSFIEERRVRRSGDKELALSFQLEHVRERGRLEALVLVDPSGGVVATAGDPLVCRELGFLTPIMARSIFRIPMPPLLRGADVAIRPVEVHGRNMFLASVGGGVARDALLSHSARGVQRILQAN